MSTLKSTGTLLAVALDNSVKVLALHFLQRFSRCIERGQRIDPDELPVLLNFLTAYQADLRPTPSWEILQ